MKPAQQAPAPGGQARRRPAQRQPAVAGARRAAAPARATPTLRRRPAACAGIGPRRSRTSAAAPAAPARWPPAPPRAPSHSPAPPARRAALLAVCGACLFGKRRHVGTAVAALAAVRNTSGQQSTQRIIRRTSKTQATQTGSGTEPGTNLWEGAIHRRAAVWPLARRSGPTKRLLGRRLHRPRQEEVQVQEIGQLLPRQQRVRRPRPPCSVSTLHYSHCTLIAVQQLKHGALGP